MSLFSIITIPSLIFLGYKAITKINAADKITFDIIDLKNFSIYNWQLDFDLIAKSENPTSTAIKVKYLFLEVFFPDDIKLAQIKRTEPFTLKAKKSSQISLRVSVNLKNILLQQAPDLIPLIISGHLPNEIIIKGYMQAAGANIPYEKHFQIK